MQNLSDQALPDSTTTSFLAHDPQMTLTVTADTCGPEENFAEEFFLAGDQTFLGDDVSAYLGNTDLKRSDQLLAGVDKKDLLSNAIMSMDSTDNNSNNSSVISNDVVSSTIHGFPEAQSEFLTPVLDQQDQFGTPVIVLSAPDQQQQSSPPSSQAPPSSAATATPTVNPSDVYTLTLTDGSVVQLRVQQPDLPQPQMAEEQPQQEVWASQPRSADLNTQLPLVAEEVTLPYTGSMSSSNESVSSYDPDEALDDEALISMFSSVDNVTIETLKAQLTSLPEGQSADLGALLVAAKIDLTVEDIVGPPLAQVKRVMEQKSLADWQVQLCIKIRRRKKNTAAVRSSRRKRNQYVASLRQEVSELIDRRKEAQEENALLKKLHGLWERLCTEVEAEIQEGVRRQVKFGEAPEVEDKVRLSKMRTTRSSSMIIKSL